MLWPVSVLISWGLCLYEKALSTVAPHLPFFLYLEMWGTEIHGHQPYIAETVTAKGQTQRKGRYVSYVQSGDTGEEKEGRSGV